MTVCYILTTVCFDNSSLNRRHNVVNCVLCSVALKVAVAETDCGRCVAPMRAVSDRALLATPPHQYGTVDDSNDTAHDYTDPAHKSFLIRIACWS